MLYLRGEVLVLYIIEIIIKNPIKNFLTFSFIKVYTNRYKEAEGDDKMRKHTRDKLEQVAELLNEGMPQKDIAEELGISESRVSSYKKQIKQLNLYESEEDDIVAITLFPTRDTVDKLKEYGDPRRILNQIINDIVEGGIHIEYGHAIRDIKGLKNLDEVVSNPVEPVIISSRGELPENFKALIEDEPVSKEGDKRPSLNSNPADDPEPPKVCPECGEPNPTIFEDTMEYQCDNCLALESYK